MTVGGRRNVELDLRQRIARDAQIGVPQLRHASMTSVESVLNYLVSRSYGSTDRLLDARRPARFAGSWSPRVVPSGLAPRCRPDPAGAAEAVHPARRAAAWLSEVLDARRRTPCLAGPQSMSAPTPIQVGRAAEHYVVAEIHRRGGWAACFGGNMPKIDVLASDFEQNRKITIQVKAKRGGSSWQTSIRRGRPWVEAEAPADRSGCWWISGRLRRSTS